MPEEDALTRLERRVAFLMTAPVKTSGLGVAVLGAMYGSDAGEYTLPVVLYHTVQMIVAAVLCGPVSRRVAAVAAAAKSSLADPLLADEEESGAAATKSPLADPLLADPLLEEESSSRDGVAS